MTESTRFTMPGSPGEPPQEKKVSLDHGAQSLVAKDSPDDFETVAPKPPKEFKQP